MSSILRLSRRVATRLARPAVVVPLVLALVTPLMLPGWWPARTSHLPSDLGDPLFNLYLLKWGAHQLDLGLPDFWNANFFYPAPRVLALSDHLFGPALVSWALANFGVGAVEAYNLLFLASFFFAALASYWLFRRCGLRFSGALVGALGFAFSHFRWMHLNHLQLLWIPFLPLAIGTFDRLLERPTPRRATAFVATYAAHLSGGTYLGFMIHLPMLAILVLRAPQFLRDRPPLRRWLVVAGTAMASLVCVWIAFSPYLEAGRVFDLRRDEASMRDWGATLLSFVTPHRESWCFPGSFSHLYRNENALFAGFTISLLAVSAAWRGRRRLRLPGGRGRQIVFLVGAAAVAIALSAGEFRTWTGSDDWSWGGVALSLRHYARPARLLAGGIALIAVAVWSRRSVAETSSPMRARRRVLAWASLIAGLATLPIVYVPLARALPGFDAMRVPARFYVFASLGLCLAAGAGAERLLRKVPLPRRRAAAAFLIALVLADLRSSGIRWAPLPDGGRIPDFYRRLGEMPEVEAVAELPLPGIRSLWVEYLRMYFSTAHWKPIVNGASGHFPRPYLRLVESFEMPPSAANLEALRGLGVTHLVLSTHRRDRKGKPGDRMSAARSLEARREARILFAADGRILLALNPAPPGPP